MDNYEETCLFLQGARRQKERFQLVDLRFVEFLDRFILLQFKFGAVLLHFWIAFENSYCFIFGSVVSRSGRRA